ncbi:MAG TPA: hypothetical protein VF381_11925 [Thermoanaerobaculia bacterium]
MIFAALLIAATTTVPSADWKATLDDYKTNLAEHHVEKTFLDAAKLEQELLPILDKLSTEDFNLLQETAAGGLQISRKGMIYVHPDGDFFGKMAQDYGGRADVNFFEEFQKSFPSGPMPSWVKLTENGGACVDAKGDELPTRKRGWQLYQGRFPDNYRSYVTMLLRGMQADSTDPSRQCR